MLPSASVSRWETTLLCEVPHSFDWLPKQEPLWTQIHACGLYVNPPPSLGQRKGKCARSKGPPLSHQTEN